MDHCYCGNRLRGGEDLLARDRRDGLPSRFDLPSRVGADFSHDVFDHGNPLALAYADAWDSDEFCPGIRPEHGGGVYNTFMPGSTGGDLLKAYKDFVPGKARSGTSS